MAAKRSPATAMTMIMGFITMTTITPIATNKAGGLMSERLASHPYALSGEKWNE